jgi:hypothetical protein
MLTVDKTNLGRPQMLIVVDKIGLPHSHRVVMVATVVQAVKSIDRIISLTRAQVD